MAPLDTWAIISHQDDYHISTAMMDEFKRIVPSIDTKGVTRAPKLFTVPAEKEVIQREWIKALDSLVTPMVQVVILIADDSLIEALREHLQRI